MPTNLKPYVFKKGMNPALDAQFSAAVDYGWVKPGQTAVFWKTGLRWYVISLSEVERIFRRVVPVYGKLCCGGRSFIGATHLLGAVYGMERIIGRTDTPPRRLFP